MKNPPKGGGPAAVKVLGGTGVQAPTAAVHLSEGGASRLTGLLAEIVGGGESKDGQMAPKNCAGGVGEVIVEDCRSPPPTAPKVREANFGGERLRLDMALDVE